MTLRPELPALRSHLRLALAALLLVLPAVRPPELHPWAGAVCALGAAAALGVAGGGAGTRLAAWACGLAPFALVSILGAANRAAAADETAFACVLVLAAWAGRAAGRDSGAREVLLRLLVALGAAVALHAAFQFHVTYPRAAAALRALDPADPTGVLVRLESGRVPGPFILPAALGGFLALALPAALRGVLKWRGGWRLGAGAAVTLVIYGFAVCRSIAALVAGGAALVVALPLLAPPGRRRPAAAAVAALAAIGVAVFIVSRTGEFRDPTGDPLTLRAGNWIAATRMIADAPWFGTGPGSFATFYPRFMQPGMNEARHAHNSYLEAAAGWGWWVLVPIATLLLACWRRTRAAWRDPDDGGSLAFLAAGAAFLAHNTVDFTAYLPGVAIPAAVLIGAGLAPADGFLVAGVPGPGRARPGTRMMLARAAASALGLGLVLHGVTAARGRLHLEEAVRAAERGDVDAAAAAARHSARLRPEDPAPLAFLAQMVLAEPRADAEWREAGEAAATAALKRDREAAILHYTRALYHATAGESAAAFRERAEARRLNPRKRGYQEPDDGAPAGPP